MLNRVISFVTAIVVATGVIACGGSSGGGNGTIIVPPPPAGELPITSDNAEDITTDVLGAIVALLDLVEIGNVANLPVPSLPAAEADLGVKSDLPFARLTAADARGTETLATRSVLVETDDCDAGTFTTT